MLQRGVMAKLRRRLMANDEAETQVTSVGTSVGTPVLAVGVSSLLYSVVGDANELLHS
jgi:hypothetical protein